MKRTCINCKYRDIDYSHEYPCCECNNKSRWEQLQDTNHQPTVEDLIILELENIKVKFEQYRDRWNYYGNEYEKTKYETYDVCIDEIDERISELKGENK